MGGPFGPPSASVLYRLGQVLDLAVQRGELPAVRGQHHREVRQRLPLAAAPGQAAASEGPSSSGPAHCGTSSGTAGGSGRGASGSLPSR